MEERPVWCDKPGCLPHRVGMTLRREKERVDGGVERKYWCPRCRRIMESIEWPLSVVTQRFEVLRKERERAVQRMVKRFGGRAIEAALRAVQASCRELEVAKTELWREFACDQGLGAYDGKLSESECPADVR